MRSYNEYVQIAELCELMHQETIFGKLEYLPKKLMGFVHEIDSDDNGLVITHGNPISAVFIGQVYSHIYTDDLIAVDQLLYVHPDSRRSGIAKQMVEEYKNWAEEKGAKLVMIGSSTDFKGAEDFFNASGFKRIGGNYGLW